MTNTRPIGGRRSTAICALRFLPLATVIPNPVEAGTFSAPFLYELRCGIVVRAFETGVFIFDCERWLPGSSVDIPSAEAVGGQRLPHAYVSADTEAFNKMLTRTQMLNCFLACMSSAISTVLHTGLWLGQEASPADYIPLNLSLEQLDQIASDDAERILQALNHARPSGESRINLSSETIKHACELLDSVLEENEVFRIVDLLYRGCWRYSKHDFSIAAVVAWAVCEKLVNILWERHLEILRSETNPSPRITRHRMDKLTGRDFTASIITEFLELQELIPHEMYTKLNTARQIRNDWMHKLAAVDGNEASKALQLAQELLNHVFNLKLLIQLSRSTSY